ncbi:MAG: nucleotidyltransferase domain-containing protein [candidate division WOR-3 bacterium]
MAPYDTFLLDLILSEKNKRLEDKRRRLLSITENILISMKRKYRIKSAYILGSLLKKRWNDSSDIDVAVSGASEYILNIIKELEDATEREVDVIDLDHHPFPEIIKTRGKQIYG